MNNFIKNIIGFSLRNKFFTFFWVGLLIVAGTFSFIKIPIEAFPDVTNTQIIIVTEWNGRSAEEVERFAMSERIREVEQGPKGALWVLEDKKGGRLLRLTPHK